jgi:hypothetical protein
MLRTIRVFHALAAVALVTTVGTAAQQRPLPAFVVASGAGAVVPSDRLNGAERWVLIYAAPTATTTDRLLPLLQEWGDSARIVVVAAAPPATIASDVLTRFRGTPAPAVYADGDGSAARALQITSVPALIGVDRGGIGWVVQGVLNDPRMVETLVRTWLAGP